MASTSRSFLPPPPPNFLLAPLFLVPLPKYKSNYHQAFFIHFLVPFFFDRSFLTSFPPSRPRLPFTNATGPYETTRLRFCRSVPKDTAARPFHGSKWGRPKPPKQMYYLRTPSTNQRQRCTHLNPRLFFFSSFSFPFSSLARSGRPLVII
jgi:hypothetical protein